LEHAEVPKEHATKAEERNQNIAGSYGVVSKGTRQVIDHRKLNFKQDIDVRGMRGDEAINAITYFIDDAILVGVSRVRILHGTGTGILRQLIRQYLGTIPNVTHYRDEHVQFGGAGITVVDLG
jgi:DNA mismatch repair protein MutS2